MFPAIVRHGLIISLLGLSCWMLFVHRDGLRAEDASAALEADGKLRAYVMTQDIEYLRNDLIELHKKHEEQVKKDGIREKWAMACWSVVLGVGMVLLGLEVIRRRHS